MKTLLFSTLSLSLAFGNLACAQNQNAPAPLAGAPAVADLAQVESEVSTGDDLRFIRPPIFGRVSRSP